jgi:hypothetical protein
LSLHPIWLAHDGITGAVISLLSTDNIHYPYGFAIHTIIMAVSAKRLTQAVVPTITLGLGLSVLYLVDPPQFKKYVKRPAQRTLGLIFTIFGFVGNFFHDFRSGGDSKSTEGIAALTYLNKYLQDTGLYEEWGADVPEHLIRNIMVLNEIQFRMNHRDTFELKHHHQTELPSLELAEYYMKFATAVYGMDVIASAQLEVDNVKLDSSTGYPFNTLEKAIAAHTNVDPKDILVADVQPGESTEYLRHMVVVDHNKRSVVLAIRGTFSMTGMLVDLAAFSDDFCGGQAHAGMGKMARATWNKASEEIALLDSVPKDYDLVVTGHSLGAGVACLITILLYYEKKHNPNMRLPDKIRCMAYASPPVFYPLSVAADAVQNTVAYVHNMDCVSSLSVDGVRRFVRTINDLDIPLVKMPRKETYPGFTPPQELVEIVNKSAKDPLPPKDRAPLLCIPAHSLVWLQEKEEDQYSTKVLDPLLYCEKVIDVHSRMVGDHMQPKYELAFHLLRKAAEDHI